MANVVVSIKLNNNDTDFVSGITSDKQGNNVSKPLVWGTTSRNNGFNGICIGKYRMGESGYLSSEINGYNGFVFREVSDNDGDGSVEISLSGTDIDSITFFGDKSAGQWATKAILDEGTADELTKYSKDDVWSIIFNNKASSHTIRFVKWNRPNYNMLFTHMEIFPSTLYFDNYWVKEITSNSQSMPDAKNIFYGILANTGSLKMFDRDGELREYAREGYLNKEDLELKVAINGNEVQTHSASDSPYLEDSRTLGIEMTNILTEWDKLKYEGLIINEGSTMTAYEILSDMLMSTLTSTTQPSVDMMCSTLINAGSGTLAEISVKDYLTLIIIPAVSTSTVIAESSLREAVEKVCLLGQLQVLYNDKGEIKFINGRPKATEQELQNAKVVPLKMQKSTFEYEMFLTNAYTDVVFS